MTKSNCPNVPGVQAENRPSPCSPPWIRPHAPEDVPESDEGPSALPERPPFGAGLLTSPEPPTEGLPPGRGQETRAQHGEARAQPGPWRETLAQQSAQQVSGMQHEIRSRVRRQKQPTQKRPPSAKSVHIYERAVIQEIPQRQVAEEFGISQSAVSRKCAQVVVWMSRVGVQELRGMNDQARAMYLMRFAERKYDFYREQAEAAHRQSLEPQVILVETGSREAGGEPGVFEGEVKIRKTVRPQTGKPSYLREARLAAESMVLLDWGCVRHRHLDQLPDPDELAEKKQEELCKQTLEKNRRLQWELERAQEEIEKLKQEAELNRGPEVGSAATQTTGAPPPPQAGGRIGIIPDATSGGRESFAADVNGSGGIGDAKDSRPQPLVPSEGLSSREREADGLAFLEEVKQVIATLDPTSGCDAHYYGVLTKLYENSRHNYRHHGVLPERQTLPTLNGARRTVPYFLTIPDRIIKLPPPDDGDYFQEVP